MLTNGQAKWASIAAGALLLAWCLTGVLALALVGLAILVALVVNDVRRWRRD